MENVRPSSQAGLSSWSESIPTTSADDVLDRHVKGFCPMCGHGLTLSATGHIECVNTVGCPDTDAVDTLLNDTERGHIVRIEDDRFHVKHPLRERVNDGMLSCHLHTELSDMDEPPVGTGVYRVTPIGDDSSDTRALGDPRFYFEPLVIKPEGLIDPHTSPQTLFPDAPAAVN